jgi:hypothetical protein
MLKSRITVKNEFDTLPDADKAHYKEENGVWLLQSDEATELRTAKEREKQRADTLEAERNRLQTEKDEATRREQAAKDEADRAAARKAGDMKTLEDTLAAQHTAALATVNAEVERLKALAVNSLINGKAEALAAEISTVPELLVPLIAARLDADISGAVGVTRIKDAAGNVSATMTIDILKKEFVDNPKFAAIVKGSNASGAGGNGGGSGGGAAGKKISEMTEAERVKFHRESPEAYKAQARSEGIAVRG